MRVLSIDASLNLSGWCIWEKGVLYDFGTIPQNKELAQHIRVHNIALEVSRLINENNIEKVVLEGLSYGSISTSVRVLSAVYFQILIVCHINQVEWEELSPTSIKKFATGSGKAKKKDMWQALPEKVKTKIESRFPTIAKGKYDICDAYHVFKLYEHNTEIGG